MTVGVVIALVLICLSLIGLILAAIYKFFETRKKLEVANQELENLKKKPSPDLANLTLQALSDQKDLRISDQENDIRKKEQEINQLNIDLKKLEQEIGNRRQNLTENLINTKKVIELEGKNKLLEESMNDLNREKDKLISENKELKENNQNLIHEKKHSDNVSNELIGETGKTKEEIAALQEKNRVLDENLKKIDEENRRLNDQMEKISNKSDKDIEDVAGEVLKEYANKQVQMAEEIKKLQSQIKNLKEDNTALKDQNEANKLLLADFSKGNKQKKKPTEIKFDESNRTLVNGKLDISGGGSLFKNISQKGVNEGEKKW